MSRRQIRLNEQLKREIAEIVRWEVADPRVGPAAVTGAEVAPDLTSARVFVALMGDDDERRESLEGLEAAAPYIRSQLAQRLDLRRTPALRFIPDETMDRAARIEELLAEVEPEQGWEAEPGDRSGAGQRERDEPADPAATDAAADEPADPAATDAEGAADGAGSAADGDAALDPDRALPPEPREPLGP